MCQLPSQRIVTCCTLNVHEITHLSSRCLFPSRLPSTLLLSLYSCTVGSTQLPEDLMPSSTPHSSLSPYSLTNLASASLSLGRPCHCHAASRRIQVLSEDPWQLVGFLSHVCLFFRLPCSPAHTVLSRAHAARADSLHTRMPPPAHGATRS